MTLSSRLLLALSVSLASQANSFMQSAEMEAAGTAAVDSIISVPLGKQYVPVMRANRTVAHKTAYFGTIYAGRPSASSPQAQNFTVVFDTGSGHFILPSVACKSSTCLLHHRYNRALSTSAVDIEYDGSPIKPGAKERDQVAIAFGTGEVTGEFIDETVCLQEPAQKAAKKDNDACVRLRAVLATEMTPDPFRLFSFDGVLGLGLDPLVLSPEFSFFGQMSKTSRRAPIFSVYLAHGEERSSEISFGGHNPQRLVPGTSLSWSPVAMPELGYWQVSIRSVRVGDELLDFCEDGTCRAILDTGTSLLGVPKQISKSMHWSLARVIKDYTPELDCRTVPGPPLVFDLGGYEVRLDPQDYSRPAAARMRPEGANHTEVFCRSSLLPVDMKDPLGTKVFIWGEPVLRRYYTAYDWVKKQVGFGVASHSEGGKPNSPCESGAGCDTGAKSTPGVPSQAQESPAVVQI